MSAKDEALELISEVHGSLRRALSDFMAPEVRDAELRALELLLRGWLARRGIVAKEPE